MTRVRAFVVLSVLLALAAPGTAQKAPPVADVLVVVTEYLASYAPRISGVSLEEVYTLLEVSGGRVGLTRQIKSDVILLNLGGRIAGLRDPYSVDDNALRERTPRITSLLATPSEAAWARAQAYAGESVRLFEDVLILRLNEPTLTLQFVLPENQPRVTYKIDGRKKVGSVETVVLKFQETKVKPPAYILDTPGKAIASGKLWVDPATGWIHKTELSMQSDSESAHIIVDYARDSALDLWLPSSMVGTYEATERVGTGMSNLGVGTPGIARRAFDCRASYANARLTPIDMRVAK
jgi:hypothetical protein